MFETLRKMNGEIILTGRVGGCILLFFTVFTKNNLAKHVNVNGFSMCISMSESSSVKAEIGHVVSWDGQF